MRGRGYWITLVGLLLGGCGTFSMGEVTPIAEIPVDLYFFPPITSDLGPWRVSEVYLDPAGDVVTVPVPGGGRTPGAVQQIFADNEGLDIRVVNRQARVRADGGDTVVVWSAPEVDGNAILRTAAGTFDVWVEPHDASLPPHRHRDIQLPQAELPLLVPGGIRVTGTLMTEQGEAAQGIHLATFPVGTADAALRWQDRGSGVATTTPTGDFSLQVPPGSWKIWAWSSDQSAFPFPATPVGRLVLEEEIPPPLDLTLKFPPTRTYAISVTGPDNTVRNGVSVTIRRRPEPDNAELAGVYTDIVQEGGGQLPSGQISMELPDGTYDLLITPSDEDLAEYVPTWVELVWKDNTPTSDTWPLEQRLTSLAGQVRAEEDEVQGVTALLVPSRSDLDTLTAISTSSGEFNFSGQLATGDYTLLLIPPIGSTLGRLSQRLRLYQGQSALDVLPELESGRAWPCQLERLDPNLAGTVVKVVPAGLSTWERTWGPGPDPRDVIGEALVEETGSFTLYLPTTLSLPVGRPTHRTNTSRAR